MIISHTKYKRNFENILNRTKDISVIINDNNFNKDFIDTFDKISTLYDNVMILGDINNDMLFEHKGAPLQNVCDIFDFVNLAKSPTCFTKGNS